MHAELIELSEKEYHGNDFTKSPCYSNSIGKILLAKSPKHAWLAHPVLNVNYEGESEQRFDIGTAAHALLLEGKANIKIIDASDYRTKNAQTERDAAYLEGKTPLLQKQFEQVQAMVHVAKEQIENCSDAGFPKLADGDAEQTIIVKDDELTIKMRLDWLHKNKKLILDYKTTDVATPQQWMKSMISLGYDMQAATYTAGVHLLTGEEPAFMFAVQETCEPYAMYFVGVNGQMLDFGKQRVNRAIAIYRDCMKKNVWPMYDNRIMYPDLPPWVEGEFLEKEMMLETKAKEIGVKFTKEQFLFGKV